MAATTDIWLVYKQVDIVSWKSSDVNHGLYSGKYGTMNGVQISVLIKVNNVVLKIYSSMYVL